MRLNGRPLGPDVEAGRSAALDVLRGGVAPEGILAAATLPHYAAMWTRDIAFSALGANISGDPDLVDAVRRSLLTVADVQARNGQIPNDHWPGRGYWDFHESGATDATALFIVAAAQHLAAHPDPSLRARLWPSLLRAYTWLTYQDANQFTLLDSPMGGDWMDSTLQRSGKLLYVNAIYYRAIRAIADLAPSGVERHRRHAERLRRKLNGLLWPEAGFDHSSLLEGAGLPRRAKLEYPHPVGPAAHAAAVRPDRAHYVSHVEGGRIVDDCDVLGNILAVLFQVADPPRSRRIMEYLHSSAAARPFPMRTYPHGFAATHRWGMYKQDLDAYQDERWRNPPGSYHNGGVWPFIGGLYVLALEQVGMADQARAEVDRLAAANRLSRDGAAWGFHEWIHADTGEPRGASRQSWSAGTFVLAVEALRGTPIIL